MADFTEPINDQRAGWRLARAFQSKAFRRFQDELYEEHPTLAGHGPPCVMLVLRALSARPIRWLVDNDIVDETQAPEVTLRAFGTRPAMRCRTCCRRTAEPGSAARPNAILASFVTGPDQPSSAALATHPSGRLLRRDTARFSWLGPSQALRPPTAGRCGHVDRGSAFRQKPLRRRNGHVPW